MVANVVVMLYTCIDKHGICIHLEKTYINIYTIKINLLDPSNVVECLSDKEM